MPAPSSVTHSDTSSATRSGRSSARKWWPGPHADHRRHSVQVDPTRAAHGPTIPPTDDTANIGTKDGSIIGTIIAIHIPRYPAAAPDQVC